MLKPTAQNVIVEIITELGQFQEDLKKRSGILLGDTIKQGEPNKGRVYAIGPDVPADAGYVVGDLVVFKKEDIFEGFRFDDKDLVSVSHDEIQAKLKEAV